MKLHKISIHFTGYNEKEREKIKKTINFYLKISRKITKKYNGCAIRFLSKNE